MRSRLRLGDSLADWLAYGLDELYADESDIGVERKIRATAGLIRYDAKNDQLDWSQVTKDALANDKPLSLHPLDRFELHRHGC